MLGTNCSGLLKISSVNTCFGFVEEQQCPAGSSTSFRGQDLADMASLDMSVQMSMLVSLRIPKTKTRKRCDSKIAPSKEGRFFLLRNLGNPRFVFVASTLRNPRQVLWFALCKSEIAAICDYNFSGVGFWRNGFFADFYFWAAGFSRISSPDFFSSCLWEKVPRKIPQLNPRQNPPKLIQQRSPTHFCSGAGPRFPETISSNVLPIRYCRGPYSWSRLWARARAWSDCLQCISCLICNGWPQ